MRVASQLQERIAQEVANELERTAVSAHIASGRADQNQRAVAAAADLTQTWHCELNLCSELALSNYRARDLTCAATLSASASKSSSTSSPTPNTPPCGASSSPMAASQTCSTKPAPRRRYGPRPRSPRPEAARRRLESPPEGFQQPRGLLGNRWPKCAKLGCVEDRRERNHGGDATLQGYPTREGRQRSRTIEHGGQPSRFLTFNFPWTSDRLRAEKPTHAR